MTHAVDAAYDEYRFRGPGWTDPSAVTAFKAGWDAALAAPAAKGGTGRHGIYIASKTAHAPRWRSMRENGLPIISTWINEAGKGETACFTDLWRRCVSEAAGARAVIVYREPDEVLKGAFVEVGAALASGVPVFAVGCNEFSFVNHVGVTRCVSVEHALNCALASPPPPAGAAGGGSGDLGALSAGASSLKYALEQLDCILVHMDADAPDNTKVFIRGAKRSVYELCSLGDLRDVVKHSVSCEQVVRQFMSKALGYDVTGDFWDNWIGAKLAEIFREAPTPDLGAQGEPVAWAYEWYDGFAWTLFTCSRRPKAASDRRKIRPLYEAPAAPRTGSGVSAEEIEPVAWAWEYNYLGRGAWSPQAAMWKPAPSDWVRNIRPLYAAPAAPRTGSGVSVEEIARAIYDADNRNLRDVWQWDQDGLDQEHPGTRERYLRQAGTVHALFVQTPRDGGETQGGWQLIETAPKEPRPIMLAMDRGRYGDISRAPVIAFWSEVRNDWRMWSAGGSIGATPTHWRPLPAPPSGVETIRQYNEGATDA